MTCYATYDQGVKVGIWTYWNEKEITMREALNDAISEEMELDGDVFLLGEEVAEYDGAYKVTQGLLNKFGSEFWTEELSFPVKGCEPIKQAIFLLKAFLYSFIISTLVLPISVMIAPSFLFLEIFLKIDLYLLTGAHIIIKSAFLRYLKLLS